MNNNLRVKVVSFLLCASATMSAAAQQEQVTKGDWSYSGYAGLASIDSARASQQGVDDSAWLVGFSADYTQSDWVTSLGLDVTLYDDKLKFTQAVEGTGSFNNGDRSTAKSSANGFLLYVATGYQWKFTEQQNVAVRLQGGFAQMVSSERSIGTCTNCYSEDINIDGGVFAKATVLRSGESVSFGAYLQQYLGDGVNTVLGITIASSF
jgi:hypothetical protein